MPIKGLYCQRMCNFVKSLIWETNIPTFLINSSSYYHNKQHFPNLYHIKIVVLFRVKIVLGGLTLRQLKSAKCDRNFPLVYPHFLWENWAKMITPHVTYGTCRNLIPQCVFVLVFCTYCHFDYITFEKVWRSQSYNFFSNKWFLFLTCFKVQGISQQTFKFLVFSRQIGWVNSYYKIVWENRWNFIGFQTSHVWVVYFLVINDKIIKNLDLD